MFTLLLYILLLVWQSSLANDCKSIETPTRIASERFLGKDYPYQFHISLAYVETKCKWIESLDGNGSIGYFQLTPKFLDRMLLPYFPNYHKPSLDYFYAFAFYFSTLYKTSPKLWIAYARYNGGDWVLKECRKAGSFEWEKCKSHCVRGNVCVWKTSQGCKQYKSACEINYFYPVKIYKNAKLVYNFW